MKFLLVIALSLVDLATSSQREMIESGCSEIDESYFNFFIDIKVKAKESPDCDLIGVGGVIQDVIDELMDDIPTHKKESLKAEFCPIPSALPADRSRARFLRSGDMKHDPISRMLRRRRYTRYSYAGGTTCRVCRTNSRVGGDGSSGRNLGAKEKTVKTKNEKEATKAKEEKDLEEAINVELDKLTADTNALDSKMVESHAIGDIEVGEAVQEEIDSIADLEKVVKDEKEIFVKLEKEGADDKTEHKIEGMYRGAEAAKTMDDWNKRFAKLVMLVLPGKLSESYGGSCFGYQDPIVGVQTELLKSKEDKITSDDCPTSL